jgi:hypothetical protein
MGRPGRRRWAARGPARIRLIEQRGAKRSLLCEGAGVPIGLADDGANRHDSKLLAPTLDSVPIARPERSAERPQALCLDGGYGYPWVDELAVGRGYTARIRRRSDELERKRTGSGSRARRWLVEACHCWLNPQPLLADPLVEETREPARAASARLRTDRVRESPRRTTRSRPTGIGPKWRSCASTRTAQAPSRQACPCD